MCASLCLPDAPKTRTHFMFAVFVYRRSSDPGARGGDGNAHELMRTHTHSHRHKRNLWVCDTNQKRLCPPNCSAAFAHPVRPAATCICIAVGVRSWQLRHVGTVACVCVCVCGHSGIESSALMMIDCCALWRHCHRHARVVTARVMKCEHSIREWAFTSSRYQLRSCFCAVKNT